MRSLGLTLFVAFALWSVSYVNSDRQQVADAYHAFIEAQASGNPHAICAQQFPSDLETQAEDIEDCAEDLARHLSRNPSPEYAAQWRTLREARVVDVEVHDDLAHAALRVDGCTLPTEDRDFERASDGRWYERTIEDADGFSPVPPCKEGGEIPPPELAWTWQDRRWR